MTHPSLFFECLLHFSNFCSTFKVLSHGARLSRRCLPARERRSPRRTTRLRRPRCVAPWSRRGRPVVAPWSPRGRGLRRLDHAVAQGWEALLHEAYVRSADVLNRGLSGYNTRLSLQYAMPGIVQELMSYYKPTVAVVWFGVNDATLVDGPNSKQHVPLDEYKRNLVEIINRMRENAPEVKILLLSPGYVDEKQRERAMLSQGRRAGDPLDRNNAETEKYSAACAEVAAQLDREDVSFLDVYAHFSNNYPSEEQRAKVLRDGLHFTSYGDHLFYQLVKD